MPTRAKLFRKSGQILGAIVTLIVGVLDGLGRLDIIRPLWPAGYDEVNHHGILILVSAIALLQLYVGLRSERKTPSASSQETKKRLASLLSEIDLLISEWRALKQSYPDSLFVKSILVTQWRTRKTEPADFEAAYVWMQKLDAHLHEVQRFYVNWLNREEALKYFQLMKLFACLVLPRDNEIYSELLLMSRNLDDLLVEHKMILQTEYDRVAHASD